MKKLLVSLLMGCLVLGMVACGSNADSAPQDGGNDTVVETPVDTEPVATEPATEPETEAVTEPETEPATEPETEAVVEKEEPEKQEVAVTPAPAPVEPETTPAPVEPEVVLEKAPWVLYNPVYDAATDSVYYFRIVGNELTNYQYAIYAGNVLLDNTQTTGTPLEMSFPQGTFAEGEIEMIRVYMYK